jgi:hypothetical protein
LRPDSGLEGKLLLILAEVPDDVVVAVKELGIQTAADFRHVWASSQACYDELERRVGRTLSRQEALKLAVAWTNSRREALRQVESLSAAVARERQSSVSGSTRAVEAMPAAPAEPGPSTKMRRLLTTGLPVEGVSLVTAATTQSVHAKTDAAKMHKLNQLFVDILVDHVLNLAELGVTLESLADPMELQKFKDTTLASASRLSVQRLGALVAAFRRWQRYCAAHGHDVRTPTPLHLAEFLREISSGGPTAAAGMHACLRWFASSYGAAFPTDHWMLKHFRFHAVHYTGTQAPELEPWEFINLILLMKKAQGAHRVILAQMLMAALGCIRFEHLQRSQMVGKHESALLFQCSQGKARKQGARPGYQWGLPQGRQGSDVPPASFVPRPGGALGSHRTYFIQDKPMTRARFLELFRGALYQAGVEFSQAQAAGYNRLRRFLPTMANVMELPDLDLQAVGNWTEIPSGGGRDPAQKKGRHSMPMGVHYAASKVLRSLQVKQRCVDRLMSLFHKKTGELARTDAGLLCRDSWQWAEVAAIHQMMPDEAPAAATPEGAIEVAPGALDAVEGASAGSEPPPLPAADGSSTSDSSSSASDDTADGQDLAGCVADDTAVEDMPWFRQGKKYHAVREEIDGRQVPWCRDFAFVQDPSARGRGFAVIDRAEFCQRCLSRMPRGLYLSLAQYCQWLS